MNEEQITALAREYAEDLNPIDFYDGDITERNRELRIDKENAELLLDWLSCRYCLVEKSKVKQLKQCFGSDEVYEVIDMLFPEIAKESENANSKVV